MKYFFYIFILFVVVGCSQEKTHNEDSVLEDDLSITISDEDFQKLKGYREEAIKNGVINKSLKKYIKATVVYQGSEAPVKLRLKGDWIDHLKGDKWSFRIKVSGDNAIMGLKSFSIQSPHTRSFLHEWFMHKLYEKENVLTTRYEFVSVTINGEKMGVYALEEHFDKQLVESRKRREGPILKFNEEGVWETRVGAPSSFHSLPYFAAAEVVPFKKNRTIKSPALRNHFKTAQSLLLRFKNFDKNIEEIFDLDKLAKFYALTDIANTDHPLIWHNLRYYYNPVSRKLEPIAYDCYPEAITMSKNTPIFGYSASKTEFPDYQYIHYSLFNNQAFKALYLNYLKKYANKEYITQVINELDKELRNYGSLINQEYPEAVFDEAFYYENVKEITKVLPDFEGSNINYLEQFYGFEDFTNSKTYYYNTGLKAYKSPYSDSTDKGVLLYNFHSTSVTIIGYSIKQNKDSLIYLDEELTIAKHTQDSIHKINLPEHIKSIFFIANNSRKDTLKINVNKWAFDIKQLNNIETINPLKTPSLEGVKVNSLNKLITIEKGSYTFDTDVIIPSGWTFVIRPGVNINLVNKAAIISYSPIEALGTEDNKIYITSTDSTGQGLTVIDNYKNSFLSNVYFSNLTTINKYGWFLTGAVTFYQSNVVIDSCVFANNACEDALNLVQSIFSLNNSTITNTYSDGFDADFCEGVISNSFFKNTGNDCIDLSGSVVEINGSTIQNSGDKGVSGGEKSNVIIDSCTIQNAKIAVASKDLSEVLIKNSFIENVQYGYVSFRKKPEYGPAIIHVSSMTENSVKTKSLIGLDSKIIFDTDTIIGNKKINVDSLYL